MKTEVLVLVASCCLVHVTVGHKWYSSVPVLPAVIASSKNITEPLCNKHSTAFLHALDNYKLWAVQMLDASAKVVDGILDGSTYQLGQFDQCLAVSSGDIRGQYCLVDISFKRLYNSSSQNNDDNNLQFNDNVHVWDKIKESEDRTKVPRNILHMGLCIPSSCSAEQLEMTLNYELKLLADNTGVVFKARVPPRRCATQQESQPWSMGEIVYSCVIALLVLLVVLSTWYVHTHHDISQYTGVEKFLLCFAAQRSLSSLSHTPEGHPGLDSIDGYRCIFMCLTVIMHRVIIYCDGPVSDFYLLEQAFQLMWMSVFVRFNIFIDFFFMTSGMLRTYHMLRDHQENKPLNLPGIIIRRLLRLTPTYMAVVFFYATLFYRMGSGPLWERVIGLERDRCQANWWTNLLYINNYVNTEGMCMCQSWYSSVDTQLFILCVFLVYCICRWPSFGYTSLAVTFVISVLVPFINVWWWNLDAFNIPYFDVIGDVPISKYHREMYVTTHNRASTYLIGIIIGVVLVKFKDSTFRLSKLQSIVGILMMLAAITGSIVTAYPFYSTGATYTRWQAALYAPLSQIVFAASHGGIFLLITFGQLGTLKRFLSCKPLRILSKLTYGVYMVHVSAQLYIRGTLRVPLQVDVFSIAWGAISDIVFGFFVSFLLMLLLESPVRSLEKLFSQWITTPTNKRLKTS